MSDGDATAEALLVTLREATGDGALRYAEPPAQLAGGYHAEMFRFRLAGAPPELDRDLVARILPDPGSGAWEATIQRYVADQGFPTPAVRVVAPETSPLGRFLIVMDAVDGSPPMSGLRASTVARQVPALLRHLPDQMAEIAARLHSLDAAPLADELARLGSGVPFTTAGYVRRLGEVAASAGRGDLAVIAERLGAREVRGAPLVVTHGDLHPFNLLVGPAGTVVIDWTVARVAHPAFTVAFTTLLLRNPPVPLRGPAAAGVRIAGRRIARRFLRSYHERTDGTPAEVDDAQLAWHSGVHALRILVELELWLARSDGAPQDHPWTILEPRAAAILSELVGPAA